MNNLIAGNEKETLAQRAIEDQGFVVHNANIVFRHNCRNIDLIVYSKTGATYIQVKSSSKPAGHNSVLIEGSPWTQEQLYQSAPIFNKHDGFHASFVVIVDTSKTRDPAFYVAPPNELERLVRSAGLEFAKKPKKDMTERSIKFRKELPKSVLEKWRGAWYLLGDPISHL